MTYCVEIWGNTYKTNIHPIFILQKRAIRIIHKTAYREPTNPLFVELKTVTFLDLIDYRTIQIMFKANNHQLPHGIQELFQLRESKYNLRGTCIFKKPSIRTNTKLHCITTKAVSLWNNCNDKLKKCTTISKQKKLFRNQTLNCYDLEQ